MAIRRLFGVKRDAVAGGSEYDDLVAGAIPNADIFWPVTGGTLDKNPEYLDRNAEVRGRRASQGRLPFRQAPVMTVPVPAYRSVIEFLLAHALGGDDTISGAGPAKTHTLTALGFGSTALPAVHAQLVRDDLNQKMSGSSFQRVGLNFPLDGEGTAEFELWGLYQKHDVAAAPTAAYTEVTDVMMLRDAQVFIDGSASAIPDLQGFEFSWTNNLGRKHYAKRNVVTQVVGTPALTRKLWFPAENKLGASQDVTFAINFGNVNTAQELAFDYQQVEKFVFEVTGGLLAGGTTEILRITIFAGELGGGGPEALSARDDITARYEGNAFYSDADLADVEIEVINESAIDLITGV
jgi:hypothetical protein